MRNPTAGGQHEEGRPPSEPAQHSPARRGKPHLGKAAEQEEALGVQ